MVYRIYFCLLLRKKGKKNKIRGIMFVFMKKNICRFVSEFVYRNSLVHIYKDSYNIFIHLRRRWRVAKRYNMRIED